MRSDTAAPAPLRAAPAASTPSAPPAPAAAPAAAAAHDPAFRTKLVLAFGALYIVWGSTYLAIRIAIETMPGFLMAGARFLVAGSVLYAYARVRGGAERPTARQWRATAVVGALLLLGGNGGVVWAEQRVPSGLASLIVATVPLWMVLLDWARPGGRRPTLGVAAGLALGTVGLAVLVGPGVLTGHGAVDTLGALALVGSALSWASGSVYAQHAAIPRSPLLATGMEMLAGGVLLTVAAAVTGHASVSLADVSLRSWLALAYLVVFGSFVGYTAYVWLLKVAPPARVATYAYVNPVVAVLLGWAVLAEPLTPRTWAAAGIIVAGVATITLTRKPS
jgi:drug/metabolite transporter (DMT)-like permease